MRKSNVATSLSTVKTGLFYSAAASLLMSSLLGCQASQEEGVSYEEVKVTEPTKGVITKVKEVKAGEYELVEEQIIDSKSDSKFIIENLDGTTKELNLQEAQALVKPEDKDSTQVNRRYGNSGFGGLGSMLWWSGIGYMLGRSMSSPGYNGFYRRRDNNSSGFTGSPGVYSSNPANANAMRSQLYQTATTRTVTRPVSTGRSGFFSSSSRSSSSS
ncbi:MAG: hypothetical protein ACK4UP_12665 [Spirosomataceae bacterium]